MAEHDLDLDKVDEAALALLWFAFFNDYGGTRAWKGMAWEITNRLHEKGWILDPKNASKSVVITEEGEKLAEEFVDKYFGRKV